MNNFENISIKTVDGKIIDGNAVLGERKRVSEIFTDNGVYFIFLSDTIDETGTKKNKIFINKDLVVWVKPRDIINTTNKSFLDNVKYINLSIKTIEGVIIDGKLNVKSCTDGECEGLDLILSQSISSPFVILKDAVDSLGNTHHTLFINKKSIISIEEN